MRRKIVFTVVFFAVFMLAAAQQANAFCNAGTAYGFSDIVYDDQSNIVAGYSSTELDYCAGLYYDPYVEGYLYSQHSGFPLDSGYSLGYADWYPAEVFTLAEGVASTQYTVLSDHYVVAYYYYTECGYYGYYGCEYYNYYWYDPWGYDFLPGGDYGSWWSFNGFYPGSYYYYQYYYIGTTGDSLITPSFCVIQSSSSSFTSGAAAASAECEEPTVEIVFGETGPFVPLAGSAPAGSAAVVDTVTVKAEGSFFEGTFTWSVVSGGDKVQLSNTTSEVVTVKAVKASGARNDVTLQVSYKVPGFAPVTDQKTMTVQKPTAMRFVNVIEGDRPNTEECAAFPNTAGRQKDILWRVVDQFSPSSDMKFSMPISSTMNTNSRENSCRLTLSGIDPGGKKKTDGNGAWPHHYHFCTGQCTGGRTCTTTGTQNYNVNGFDLKPIPFTFSCGGISLEGDGSTRPRSARSAAFVRQTTPSSVEAGGVYPVSVTMTNTGTETWTAGSQFRLGSQNYQDNYTWGLARVELPASVPPDGEVTFNFNITAPPSAGIYNFQWAMVQDGVEWFGQDTNNVAVEVTSPITFCDWWMEQNCYDRGGWWDYGTCSCYQYYYY
jgi:hypothetical protein